MAEGEIQPEQWKDKQGNDKSDISMFVKNIKFLDSKSSPQQAPQFHQQAPAPNVAQAAVNNFMNQQEQQQDYATNPNDYVEDTPF